MDKIQNFVLSNKNGKTIDISGQITKAKQEVEELDKKFNSSERADVEKESILCKEYSDFLETALI